MILKELTHQEYDDNQSTSKYSYTIPPKITPKNHGIWWINEIDYPTMFSLSGSLLPRLKYLTQEHLPPIIAQVQYAITAVQNQPTAIIEQSSYQELHTQLTQAQTHLTQLYHEAQTLIATLPQPVFIESTVESGQYLARITHPKPRNEIQATNQESRYLQRQTARAKETQYP